MAIKTLIKVGIIAFIIFVVLVLGMMTLLVVDQFKFPSGESCEAWINEELKLEQTCPDMFLCVENRFSGLDKGLILAEGHDESNPAIGECTRVKW